MLQELVDLCEGRGGLELLEDLASLMEDGAGFARSAAVGEAAALAEQGERLLGNDTERLPALGGIGVPGGRGLEVAVGLGEGGACRHQGVFMVGRAWLDSGDEPLRELGIAECEGSANHRGQVGGIVLVLAAAGSRLDLGEEGDGLLVLSEGGAGAWAAPPRFTMIWST